jgi:phage-related protein
MTKWNVAFYETTEGECEVEDFLKTRKPSDKQKAIAWLKLLEAEGPQLPRPFADLLRDGIHELRIKLSGDQIRILYFFSFKDIIILTHSFTKNTEKVPNSEIEKALRIKKEFLIRFPKREALNEILKAPSPSRTEK